MELDFQIQKPLRELVYLELKRRILTGEIDAHTRLMEIDLAEKMNVSRTPIREAIRKLANEGLVVIEPRHGAYVSEISIKDLEDVFEVRETLGGLAASIAAVKATDEDKAALQKLLRLGELAMKNDDKDEMVEYDVKLHNYIVQCSGNKTLMQMVKQAQELSMRFRYVYYESQSKYMVQPIEHKKIVDAIVAGDSEAARKAAAYHINTLRKFVVEKDKGNGMI